MGSEMCIRDRYQTLPANTQKILLIAGCIFALLILVYIPYSYINSSSSNITKYNNNRSLIRDLFKYSRTPKGNNALPGSVNPGALSSEVRSSLGMFNLLPEQIMEVQEIPTEQAGKPLVKPPIKSVAVKAAFKQLNLTQVVDIAFHFKKFRDHIKLIGLNINEDNEKPQYFNVDFKLIGYSYPVKKIAIDKGKGKKKKRSKKKRR